MNTSDNRLGWKGGRKLWDFEKEASKRKGKRWRLGWGLGCDARKSPLLGGTTSWFPREKPNQARKQWDLEVAGHGDRHFQLVEGMGRDRGR